MKNELKGERRDSLLVQRGGARNFVRVLSRLTSSKAMLTFLK